MFLKSLEKETPSLNRGKVLQKASKHDKKYLRVLESSITLETSLAYNVASLVRAAVPVLTRN
jgi:hypothetical protein